jgi:tetratricopeptide (TPR) repeat protein
VDVQLPGSYEQESWQLTVEEKAASISQLQRTGNEYFANGEVKRARTVYFEALARLETLALREQPGSDEARALEEQKTPLLLNYALCLMKEGELHEALLHLNTAIEMSPSNVKGFFRRGKVNRLLGNWEEARADLNKAEELDASLRSTVAKETAALQKEERDALHQDKKKFQKLFQT